MTVRVTGGQQVPVDLRVTRGESACDESNLTGESRPVPKAIGRRPARRHAQPPGPARRPRAASGRARARLQKVIRLIENAQTMRAPAQRFTDKFGTSYTYGVLGLCAAMFFVWWLGFGLPAFVSPPGGGTRSAFYRAMTLLVVASPCALVLSIPSAILSAIAYGARRGVLFRGGAALESLAKVDVVALDKTGTLTAGDLQLVRVETFAGSEDDAAPDGLQPRAVLRSSALARHQARGPARRICRCSEPENFESLPGRGLARDVRPPGIRAGPARSGATSFLPARGATAADGRGRRRGVRRRAGAGGPAGFPRRTPPGSRRDDAPTARGGRRNRHAHRRPAPRPPSRSRATWASREVRAGLLPEDKLAAVEELKAGRHPARGDDRRRRQRRAEPRRRRRERGDGRAGLATRRWSRRRSS